MKQADLYKYAIWALRALVGIITFFLIQFYMQVQELDKRVDRLSVKVQKVEDLFK